MTPREHGLYITKLVSTGVPTRYLEWLITTAIESAVQTERAACEQAVHTSRSMSQAAAKIRARGDEE